MLNGKTVFAGDGAPMETFLENAYQEIKMDYPKFYKMDNLSKVGVLAAEVLLREKDIATSYSPEQVTMVLSNRAGSLDADQRYFRSMQSMASPALFVYTLPNIVAGEISIRHSIKGESVFFVSPYFDAQLISTYVASLAEENRRGLCIAGWVDMLGEQHDVFLYLQEFSGSASLLTKAQIRSLYKQELWNN